jgi:hypothetical protein
MRANKKAEKKAAKKREKQKKNKIILVSIVSVAAICLAVVIAFSVISRHGKADDRIFETQDGQMIVLRTDGTFNVMLAHNVAKRGTYTEDKRNGAVNVTFNAEDGTVSTNISNNILFLPVEWYDGHGHGTRFQLR